MIILNNLFIKMTVSSRANSGQILSETHLNVAIVSMYNLSKCYYKEHNIGQLLEMSYTWNIPAIQFYKGQESPTSYEKEFLCCKCES